MRKWIIRITEVLLLCVIVFCLWKIGSYFLERKASDDSFKAIEKMVEKRIEAPKGKEEEKLDYKALLRDLREENEDVVAYLQVTGTKINYPVVQAKDNDFYLRRGIDKKYSFPGIPYLDYRNNADLEDQNTIIYGHMINIGTQSMFGYFQDFLDQDFTDQSPKEIRLINDEGIHYYRMIAMDFLPEEADYRQPEREEKEFLDYTNRLIKNSEVNFQFDQTVLPRDKVLTLSTCPPDQDLSQRLAVLAVLTRVEK